MTGLPKFHVTALASALTALLAGCSLAPTYERPAMDVPAHWQTEAPWRAAQPADDAPKGPWWQRFNDPQLDKLIEQALRENQSLKVALTNLEQAQALTRVARASLLPTVTASSNDARTRTSAFRPLASYSSPTMSTVQDDFVLRADVSYEADLFGRVRNTVSNAKASEQQAAANLENFRLLLAAQVATTWYNLRETDAEIAVVQEGLALQRKALDFVTSRHQDGVASGLDLAQQQALVDSTATQAELLTKQRAQYEHALATLVGTPAPAFHIDPTPLAGTPPTIPVALPSDVIERRPDVAAAERGAAAANAQVGVARAAFFPSVMLSGGAGWESRDLALLFSAPTLLWSFGTQIAQTVFDAGRTSARVDFANAAYQGSIANYRQTVLGALQEVEDGLAGLQSLDRAATQARAAVASARKVYDIASVRYEGGLATSLDVITAQQSLLNNQRTAVQILGQQLTTSVFLVKAVGGDWNHPTTPPSAKR
ncbi:efflux transporter, outer membrane factor (OMF) lipo, NodT family protein [Ralstonia insidiosa]|uniref:Efflux transporter, outer membrane factor (OMF) lipo, NodT family protein n=1 Tax=Ralstonia insidiosa TaxID=190721 RepID=A0AAC9BN13_9RALS|nr:MULTISPECIES: efflux transporter outer membrane subunit [Ralstonia]ANH75490.1 efflux transporter, outer membrane factor (OMF) lipo, NodT family protein [Ralstonia insidiosa]EPX99113.1 RND transporter [Ralstonia sp. AU12-08]